MSTAEEEEGQVSFVSEVSLSPKRALKTCHLNFVQKDNGERAEHCDANNASIPDFHSIVKSNSIIASNKTISGKFNHNSDHRDTHESDEHIKSILGCESAKKDEVIDSEERDSDENKASRIVLTPEQLSVLSKEELVEKWAQQDVFINTLNSSLEAKIQEVSELRRNGVNEERLKAQLSEIQRKEQYHIMRLATKEHEIQELGAQIEELKNLAAGGNSLKQSLLDPAVNLLFERMKRDFDTTKSKMEEAQNELAAWKFTPDSNTGKQLMAKCRLLIKENEELGKMISSGRLSKLEGDLALQRNFSDELKKSQSELEEFLQEMDEDTEGMQGTILYLQSQLRQAKEKIAHLTTQLSLLGGQTTSNNTLTSLGEAADYAEGSLSETDPLPNEDSLQHFDERRTLLESSDAAESALTNAKANGEILASNSSNSTNTTNSNSLSAASAECNRSGEGLNAHSLKSYANGRNKKRTQSVFDEGDGEERGEAEAGEGETHPHPHTPPQNFNKRTRLDIAGGGEEGVVAVTDHVIENGLTIK